MQFISGLVPTNQKVIRLEPYPYVYRSVPRRSQPLVRRGFLAFLLLTLAFLLMLWGGGNRDAGLSTVAEPRLSEFLSERPMTTVAAMAGYGPVETVQLLWERGIDINEYGQGATGKGGALFKESPGACLLVN